MHGPSFSTSPHPAIPPCLSRSVPDRLQPLGKSSWWPRAQLRASARRRQAVRGQSGASAGGETRREGQEVSHDHGQPNRPSLVGVQPATIIPHALCVGIPYFHLPTLPSPFIAPSFSLSLSMSTSLHNTLTAHTIHPLPSPFTTHPEPNITLSSLPTYTHPQTTKSPRAYQLHMDECPVNSIEHPFLTEGDPDPAAQGHRGSSPQRDFRLFDLQMPVFSNPGASGTGEGNDGHDDHSSPHSSLPPAPRSSPTLDFSLSFGESQAANALVAFGAGWPASSPTTQLADASFAQLQTAALQTTICPADVRPRAAQTFTLFPELALHYDSGSPPSYEAATGDYDSLAPDDLIMSFSTRIEDGEDVETHSDVYEAKPLAHGQWHPNNLPSSLLSAYPSSAGTFVASEYEYDGGTAHHDPWRTNSDFGQHRRRPPLSRDSSFAESASFVTARHLSSSPSLVTLDNSPMTLDLPYTPRFGHSPTASNGKPVLDIIGYGSEADAPYKVDEDVTMSMDSPEQVFHQLTDPIDGTELTDAGSDDEDYVERDVKEEKEDEEWSRSPTRQMQNQRRTFKMALWE